MFAIRAVISDKTRFHLTVIREISMDRRSYIPVLVACLIWLASSDKLEASDGLDVQVVVGCGWLWLEACEKPEDKGMCITGIWFLENGLAQNQRDSDTRREAQRKLVEARTHHDNAQWKSCRDAVQKGVDLLGSS